MGWFILDALTHLTIEASYLFLALTVTAEKSDSLMALTWKEYGKADHVRLHANMHVCVLLMSAAALDAS